MNRFDILPKWPAQPDARDHLGATFGSLQIFVGDKNVTAFEHERRQEERLELPTYYLAEWIAENWWPLLWEPTKRDEHGADPDYLSRHSFLLAQNGFVLPNIVIAPGGNDVDVRARPRTSQVAQVRFPQGGDARLSRSEIEAKLRSFVQANFDRMDGALNTPLEQAWQLVLGTDEASAQFCRYIGALGLSPYDTHAAIEDMLDQASDRLPETMVMDLCATSTPANFVASARVATMAHDALRQSREVDLATLTGIPTPADIQSLPAYKTGYRAADTLRSNLKVSDQQIHGASTIYGRLGIDVGNVGSAELAQGDLPLFAAVERNDNVGRVALIPENSSTRRFAAARATYFLWTGGAHQARFVTDAGTREQQASRSFAAELLLPRAVVRTRFKGTRRVTRQQIYKLAEEAIVDVKVARHQAENAGFSIAA